MKLEVSLNGLDILTDALERYADGLDKKTQELRNRVGQELQRLVQRGFAGAVSDTTLAGADEHADVSVNMTEDGNVTVVMALGEDAVWAEFGAGVWFNGNAGSSPHPRGEELGMTIGGYGKGRGKRETWGYYRDGELHITHGTPASMPMWNASRTVIEMLPGIAREVFRA